MKKLLIIFTIVLLFCGCGNNNEEKTADYCLLINKEIKQCDFSIAKIEPGKIVLYSEKMSILKKIDFPDYDKSIDILYIEKYENKILFALSGWLDDSSGFMIVNEEASFSETMAGVRVIELYKPGIYKYKTYS